ncbi:MAG: bifunctional glutamate N-acetyltransferase/amino-acid acetyltransferase ArgJ [Oscillospiraceae bacterium]|nr:bifunctional glutamate N-acetyltransferase/amino-acid acetyltransferase ArgJ [Oscillospiraceae bacterium]
MKEIAGGVCAANGFSATGIHCGIRKSRQKNDLALIFSDRECSAAAVYTTNMIKAAPLLLTKEHLKNGMARAIAANSGIANACAPGGEENARRTCAAIADQLGIGDDEIIVNSTGVIGVPLPIENIEKAVGRLVSGLSSNGSDDAAQAIMTTDTVPKQAAVQAQIAGKTITVGGIAKGSGMIHPDMATMLAFLTTDAAISSEALQKALNESNRITYNRISVDGDTSTNDMAAILANGAAGNPQIEAESDEYRIFLDALSLVNGTLARMIARDGEGATRLVSCRVTGAGDEDSAEQLAKSVISSNLVKAAMFGADANWGRVICAMGYSKAQLDPETTDVAFASEKGSIDVCRAGAGLEFDEDLAKKILSCPEVQIIVNVNGGEFEAEAFGCDLTYDYVKINCGYRGEYRT